MSVILSILQHDRALHISSEDKCAQNVFRNVRVACNTPWDFTFFDKLHTVQLLLACDSGNTEFVTGTAIVVNRLN